MEKHSIFLDTNIVADMIDPKRRYHPEAMELLKRLMLGAYRIVISEDMVTTLYYISQDKEATLAFLEHIVYVDWEVVPFGTELLQKATQHAMKEVCDLEDTLQCLCSAKEGCSMLVTEDRNFVTCGVKMMDYESALHEIG
jgi:predicted nucleic acid-binding protein